MAATHPTDLPRGGARKERAFTWTRRHLLGLEDLSREEILHLLNTARGFREISTRSVKKAPALRGKVVVNLFFEPSTRTRTSFSLAAKRLSADVQDLDVRASSTSKGETMADTARNVEAMGIDLVVVRTAVAGGPKLLSERLNAAVINAGDGAHEHPTQGLLDIFTVMEHKGKNGSIEGVRVAFVGDISHSRVARSNIHGLLKLGAQVAVIGPTTLIPSTIAELGVEVYHHLDEVIGEFDVFNILRIQMERRAGAMFPSIREYSLLYGFNAERMARARDDVMIMHPGPINRGVEITPDVADGPNSVVLEQVANGLAVRMAALYLVAGAAPCPTARERPPSSDTRGAPRP